MEYTIEFLKEARGKSLFNKTALLDSKSCGCFYCLKTFSPEKIQRWIQERAGKEDSAWCPFCEMDTVLPDSFPIHEPEFMQKMNVHYFKQGNGEPENKVEQEES